MLYDSSVSVLDMKEQQLRHTLQVCGLSCAVLYSALIMRSRSSRKLSDACHVP